MNYYNNYSNTYGNGVNSPQTLYGNNLYQQNGFTPNKPYFVGNTGIVYATFEEVNAEKVQPNDVILRIDRAGDILYIKSADGLGRTNVDVYDLVKRSNVKEEKNYITKEEVEQMINASIEKFFPKDTSEPTQDNATN